MGVKKAKRIKRLEATKSSNKEQSEKMGETLEGLQKTLKQHAALRIHYWKMVEILEKEGGGETKVSKYL